MSNEQIETHIESLIVWHARFEETLAKLTDATLSLANVVQRHDDQIAGLIESGRETAALLRTLGKETDERLKSLRDAGKETDERLNVLIDLFERSFRKDKPQ